MLALAVLAAPGLAGATSKVPPYFNRELADYPFPVLKLTQAEGQPETALYPGPVAKDGLMIGGTMTNLTTARPKLVARLRASLAAHRLSCDEIRRVVLVEPVPGLGNPYWWIKCPGGRHYAVETSDTSLHHIVRAK